MGFSKVTGTSSCESHSCCLQYANTVCQHSVQVCDWGMSVTQNGVNYTQRHSHTSKMQVRYLWHTLCCYWCSSLSPHQLACHSSNLVLHTHHTRDEPKHTVAPLYRMIRMEEACIVLRYLHAIAVWPLLLSRRHPSNHRGPLGSVALRH